MSDPTFGGQVPIGGFTDRDLAALDEFERRAAFQGWLGLQWIHRTNAPEFFAPGQREQVWQQFVQEYPRWAGVDRGMSPQELVVSGQLVFDAPIALILSSKQPVPLLDRVRQKELMDPVDIVELLMRACLRTSRLFEPDVLSPRYGLLVHDGRTGHAISISHFTLSGCKFVYYDTWPGRSLLCRENNAANVNAEPHDGAANWWEIVFHELVKIIYAVIIPATVRKVWQAQDESAEDRGARIARALAEHIRTRP